MTAVRLLSLLAALVAAAALAACGGGGEDDARAILERAFGPGTPAVRSGNLDVQLGIEGQGVGGLTAPLSVRLWGPFASGAKGGLPKFDLDLAVRSARGRVQLGGISTGDRAWLVLQDRAYTLSEADVRRLNGDRDAAARPGSGAGTSLRGLGVDPRAWLREPRDRGDERLAGEEVEHVSAGVDVPRMLADVDGLLGRAAQAGSRAAQSAQVPATLPRATREAIARDVRDASVDVWTGKDDHVLRRLALTVGYERDGRPGTLRLALGVSGVNRPQAIGPPAQARPLGELATALRRLQARLRRQAAAGVEGAGAYEKCLADAGGDLALAQDCAGLVGR